MGFENLLANSEALIEHMREDGHSESYIRIVGIEIRWLGRCGERFDSYEDACRARESQTASAHMKRRYRLVYGILMRFDLYGEYPNYRRSRPLFKYGARYRLNGEFAAVIASYEADAERRGLDATTMRGCADNASSFLLAMQERGLSSLREISEEDVSSFFVGGDGGPAVSCSYAKNIRSVFSAGLGPFSDEARAVLALLPRIRSKRKNIQYLQAEEVECVRGALERRTAELTLRDRAIGSLLLLTGIRACDIAGLELGDISWERDRIDIVQSKTGVPLSLPLTAPVGNAIFDYLADERPDSADPHVFLGLSKPHAPMHPSSIYAAASRVYDAAGIRPPGSRRGTHLFRHNAATAMVGAGVPRPVASAVLGHEDPASLDHYLFADIAHLRECALDVGRFPLREGVFAI